MKLIQVSQISPFSREQYSKEIPDMVRWWFAPPLGDIIADSVLISSDALKIVVNQMQPESLHFTYLTRNLTKEELNRRYPAKVFAISN